MNRREIPFRFLNLKKCLDYPKNPYICKFKMPNWVFMYITEPEFVKRS